MRPQSLKNAASQFRLVTSRVSVFLSSGTLVRFAGRLWREHQREALSRPQICQTSKELDRKTLTKLKPKAQAPGPGDKTKCQKNITLLRKSQYNVSLSKIGNSCRTLFSMTNLFLSSCSVNLRWWPQWLVSWAMCCTGSQGSQGTQKSSKYSTRDEK